MFIRINDKFINSKYVISAWTRVSPEGIRYAGVRTIDSQFEWSGEHAEELVAYLDIIAYVSQKKLRQEAPKE